MAELRVATESLMARAADGDASAWGALMTEHTARLERMVAFRLDARLRGRVDASDVVQDAYLVATARRQAYFDTRNLPLFLWLRGIVGNKMLEVHRHHLGTGMRDAGREIAERHNARQDPTSIALMAQLTAHSTGPGTKAACAERNGRLQAALDSMEAIDREVLALRHFEQLSNAEAAHVLAIQEGAAAKRYLRALKRLREILTEMPGGLAELGS